MEKSNKMAMILAWNFFKGNYALNFAVIAILILLNLLGMVPIIGLLFILAYSILSLSVQIYFGRGVDKAQRPEDMAEFAAQSKIGDVLSSYLHVATGAFLALFAISLVFMALFGMAVEMSGGMEAMRNGVAVQAQMEAMLTKSGVIGAIFLLIAAFLFYFFPAVMGRVIRSDTFVDGFKNVFLLFSPSMWKACFNKEYFILVLVWSLILLGVGIVMIALSATIILLPVVLVIAYLLSLYNAAIYVFADDLAKE